MSYLKLLECYECKKIYDSDKIQTFCLDCQVPLLARYDLKNARRTIDRDSFSIGYIGIWRWHELLPVHAKESMIYLGEGDTPVLRLHNLGAELGLRNLFVKDESLNPTGTFKSRGLSVAISKAKELGIRKVIIPSAGNAGGALAAYTARGGMDAYIVMPMDTPRANVIESEIAGAKVELVRGLISDAAKIVKEKAANEGWFDVSTFKEPYRTEGKKIMGYELAEFFQWELPDVIIYPTGGGTGLVGMWKAFDEMQQLGWLEMVTRPRMVAVQSKGCAPVVKAFQSHRRDCEIWQDAETIASGLRVPKSFADRLILDFIRESDGCAVAVSDEDILSTQKILARKEGIFAAPEGAATVAALIQLMKNNWIDPDERILLFNTGTGLKYI